MALLKGDGAVMPMRGQLCGRYPCGCAILTGKVQREDKGLALNCASTGVGRNERS